MVTDLLMHLPLPEDTDKTGFKKTKYFFFSLLLKSSGKKMCMEYVTDRNFPQEADLMSD